MATRAGYTVCAGEKGGPIPQIARRIKRKVTKTKQRMYKLLDDPEFPFQAV